MANTPGEQEDEAFLRADLGGPATAHSGKVSLGMALVADVGHAFLCPASLWSVTARLDFVTQELLEAGVSALCATLALAPSKQ